MKKTSRVSRRCKSIGVATRYKKGKTANKKRVKRASSYTKRRIMRGGADDVELDALINFITSKLDNNVTTFDTTKLNTDKIMKSFNNIIDILKRLEIDVIELEILKDKIKKNEGLTVVEIFKVVKMLYNNRRQLAEKLTDLSTVLEAVLNIIIDKIPFLYSAPAKASAAAFIFALKTLRPKNNNPMPMPMPITDTSQSLQPLQPQQSPQSPQLLQTDSPVVL